MENHLSQDVSTQRISRVTRTRQQAKTAYDRLSRWYDLLAGGFEGRHRAAGVHKLDPQAGDVVLEIGFGTGRSIVAIARAVGASGRVHGIDISDGMLAVARTRVQETGFAARIVLQQGDALHLPFPADFFDAIFISFTLELFDTPEIPLVLAECMRTLRSGARLCVVGLSKKGGTSVLTRIYEWLHEKLPQYADCRPIFVQASLEDAGFRILDAANLSLGGLRGELVLAQKP